MARKSGLGRGLSALIPEQEARPDERIPVTEASIEDIAPNPQQPRTHIDEEQLRELADSIRAHGVIQPLLVSEQPEGDGLAEGPRYQLIAGERRWRAAQAAGLDTVPVTVRQTTSQELLELAIIENVQRADLNALEEAHAYQRLMSEFSLTQREVAERVGRSRTAIANTLRLVELPAELRESLSAGEISEGHARALLGLPSEAERLEAWRHAVEDGLNVRETERMVREWREGPQDGPHDEPADSPGLEGDPLDADAVSTVAPRPASPGVLASGWITEGLVGELQRSLGTKVALKRSKNGRGTLTIHFYSNEELEGVIERLLGEDPGL